MPRISAETVAEHVERQEAAVYEAAMRLFLERGYAAVSLADIAAAVGLKRNSLYRYFPDKAHILLRWLRRELPEQVAESEHLLGGGGDPLERIQDWATYQLDYARRPEHRLIAALPDLARDLDQATRAELADSHRRLLAPLDDALAEAGLAEPVERRAAGRMIWGLVLAAAEAESGGVVPAVRERLGRAIVALAGR
ncbi:MAG: TetR/AcrR family transcriptional regulator [Actinobacteria bacterium]|nr:TetR/AcrR family transcriptional regulator [Actinomycetota bacterium]